MLCFVGDDGVELAIREFGFVDGKPTSDVVRKQHPQLGMILLIPRVKVTQVITILFFECLDLKFVRDRDTCQGDRLGLCLILLKKRRSLSRASYQGRRVGYRSSVVLSAHLLSSSDVGE